MSQANVTFGVSATGFLAKPQQQILNEIVSNLLGTINNQLDLSPVEPVGQLAAIVAEQDAEVWEVAQIAYNSTNRGAAEGALLDNIGALIGVPRLPATSSSVWTTCVFSASGTYAVGALVGFIFGLSSQTASNTTAVTATSPVNLPNASVQNGNATVLFASVVTLPIGAAVHFGSDTVAYFLAAPVNGSTVATLTVPYGGTTNASQTSQNYYSAAVLFQAPVTGPDFGNALIAANALNPGNVGAFTGQVPVAGWFSVVDTSTATIGGPVETDTAYRIRQVEELGAQGSCNPAALAVDIENALLTAPSPVTATATVYENTLAITDPFGMPPNSFQAVVFDGLNPNTPQNNPIIAQQVWNNKPAGIASFGTISATATDSQGNLQTVYFTRPTQQSLYMTVNAQVTATANQAAVTAAIVLALIAASQGEAFNAYGQTVTPAAGAPTTLLPGIDVVPDAFKGIAQAQTGVIDVTSLSAGFVANPIGTGVIRISRQQIAVLTQVTVNLTVFTP